MRHALALLTCVPLGSPAGVRRRLPAALASLESSAYPGRVVIVDDGSTDSQHLAGLEQLARRYEVVRREVNGGISRAKNTCLRVLAEGPIDVGFLAEDDAEFRPGWHERYLAAHAATGIAHFSWASDTFFRNMRKTPREVRGHTVVETSRLNGVLLAFTPQVIARVGGFRVMPRPWGHEHIHWTNRIVRSGLAPFYADVLDSNRFIGLGLHSRASAVSQEQRARWSRDNRAAADDLSQLHWPLEE